MTSRRVCRRPDRRPLIDIQVHAGICAEDFDAEAEALLRAVVVAVLRCERVRYPAEIAVTVCGDADIRAVNRDARAVDSATDVLSFPALRFSRAGRVSRAAARAAMNYDTGCVVMGDIVISIERVRAQAFEYGHSIARELAYLTVHAMLHLLGYDHMEAADQAVMRKREEACLRPLGLDR